MGNEGESLHETEFVFRRLAEAFHIAGRNVNPLYFWPALLIPILILAAVYVGWMYARDSQSVGRLWSVFLASLRCAVYFILGFVFLLPAWQTWDRNENHSRVVLLFDVSGSMAARDDLPTEAVPVEKMLTRQDKVVRFLTDAQVAFIKRLQDKNPLSIYRFGSVVDEDFQLLDQNRPSSDLQWMSWLKPNVKEEVPPELNEDDKAKLRRKLDLYVLLTNGTNLADSLLSVINREANHMLQGVIVISDGRSTQFSSQTLEELQARARGARVPIFAVAVGEQRQPINIRIADLQAPDQARPDDKFPVRVELDGEGLAGKEAEVYLDVTRPTGEKLTLRPIGKLGESVTFKPGEPPHAQAEFEIDKPEIEGDWKLVARVPRDKGETFLGKEHVTDPVTVHVVKKPIRVLLFASAPTHDYQFTRSLFVREMDRHRAEVSVYLQLARPDIVQDVPGERLLKRFPSTLRAEDDAQVTPEDKYDNLSQYDLIIAFDPDWTELTPEQMGCLERWVGTHAGGLVVVAGPVHTFELARGVNSEKLKPILDLYPVVPEDSRLQGLGVERPTSEPWRLHFPGASSDMEFLKLDDDSKDLLAGWEEFFTGRQPNQAGAEQGLRHGFYNYYPVRAVKPSATVVATFSDPRARMTDGKEQPYIVTMPYGNGKVVYLGWGELWRLRQGHEVYNERFWTKLARFAGSGNLARPNRRGVIVMGKTFTANNFVRLEAQLFGRDMQPLARTEKPKIQIKPPEGAKMPTTLELQAKPGQVSDWNGWFAGRFLVRAPGSYELQMQIPGTPDILSSKFLVKESNPELDNTMPDFSMLRQVATDATDVLARIGDPIKTRLKPELERTNDIHSRTTADDKAALRLYFDLKAAPLIPDCMVAVTKTQRNRGPVKDIWDDGFTVGDWDPPLRVSWVLVTVVGLLSIEWLTRKLLRLA